MIAWGKISQPEAQFINSLGVINSKIVIKSVGWGQWFKNNYEYLNHHVFRDRKNLIANSELSKLLKRALIIKAIEIEDLFKDDNFVINKINNNVILRENLEQIKTKLKTSDSTSSSLQFKKRIVDPLVLESDRIALLSECASTSTN